MPVTSYDKPMERLIARLRALRSDGKKWREIADLKEFKKFGEVAPGTLCSIEKGNYEPKDNEIRRRLGLPLITVQYKDSVTGQFVKKG